MEVEFVSALSRLPIFHNLLFCVSESKIRRLDFDVEALKQVATRVTGATCTDIKTTHEGRWN